MIASNYSQSIGHLGIDILININGSKYSKKFQKTRGNLPAAYQNSVSETFTTREISWEKCSGSIP
jgi:hypothetical protein